MLIRRLQRVGRVAIVALLLALNPLAALAGGSVFCDPDSAVFVVDGAPLSISVEVADDPRERAQGLMFRKSLKRAHGMLFIYEQPQPVSFWMRNTLIPLDLIFFDETGTVRHIHRNARPLDETPIPGTAAGDPDPNRLMVLEIGGGEADALGIKIGQAMAYPAIDPEKAVISCR